jgi:hypothetical protein
MKKRDIRMISTWKDYNIRMELANMSKRAHTRSINAPLRG